MLKRLAVESDCAHHDIINFLGTFISTTQEKYYILTLFAPRWTGWDYTKTLKEAIAKQSELESR